MTGEEIIIVTMTNTDRTVSNSSVAVDHDIICKRGDSFERVFQFCLDDVGETPIDITGSDFQMDVLISKNKKPLLSFEIGAGFVITDTNELTATKTKTQMELAAGNYRYDIQQTLSDGTAITRVKGLFIIEDDETE